MFLSDLSPEVKRTVYCGSGKFTLDENDVVTQYDSTGRVVGIFSASDTPNLRTWLAKEQPKELGGPRVFRQHD